MIAFIDQEANEKVDELDAKADEEFNIEKGRLVQQQRVKILDFYERKEKQIELQGKIQNSGAQNQSRLRVLKAQEDCVMETVDLAKQRLFQVSSNGDQYREVMEKLLLQALEQLLESDVLVICRAKDVQLVQSMLDSCSHSYREATKRSIKVEIDHTRNLPEEL